MIQPDDKICCGHDVSMRKLVNFARREHPEQPSRVTECLDAGTGCGWCIPFLVQIATNLDAFTLDDMTPQEYAAQRTQYIKSGRPHNTF